MMYDDLLYVNLTPSHYFDHPEKCFRHNGVEWLANTQRISVLHPEVYWWLREHVGFEVSESFGSKRFYYPDEKVPYLPGGEVIHIGRTYSHSSGQIRFERPRDAQAFRRRFEVWYKSWDLINLAMCRVTPYDNKNVRWAVRELPVLTAVASHLYVPSRPHDAHPYPSFKHVAIKDDYHTRMFYLITEEDTEQERVMFMLRNQYPDPWFTVAA